MALENILQVTKLTSIDEIHEFMELPTLDVRRAIHSSGMMFKIDNKLAPLDITNRFIKRQDGPSTRRQAEGNFIIPKCKLEIGKCNFMMRGPGLWEKLPMDLRTCEDLNIFKEANSRFWIWKYPNGIT